MRALGLPVVFAALAVLGGATSLIGACGRSAEIIDACPTPLADCDALLVQRTEIEARHAAVLDDDVARLEAGACSATLTEAALAASCVDPCAELCRLHPCPLQNDDGVTGCAARCVEASADPAFAAAVQGGALRAAEEPQLCSYRACLADGAPLCATLFVCEVAGG